MRSMIPVLVITALFICMPIAYAVGGQWYLLSPRMVLRLDSESLPYVTSIGVRNTDSSPVDINIDVPSSLDNIVFFDQDDTNFTLESNSERWVNFTVNPEKPVNASGDIMVLFTSREPNVTNAALASEVHIVMQAEEEPVIEEKQPDTLLLVGVCVTVAAVIVALMLIRRR